MGVAVTFNYAKWVARYPEFASVSEPTAQAYFDEATIYLRNDGSGPTSSPTVQLTLLNMLTAHIAARYAVIDGKSASDLVGRISNATEGSVSVQADMDAVPGTAAWYMQTKYGADFWNATAAYRTFRYRLARGWWWGAGRAPWVVTMRTP